MTPWSGVAVQSHLDTRLGQRAYRHFYLLGVRRSWAVATRGQATLDYTLDAIPGALTTAVPEYRVVMPPCPPGCFRPPTVTLAWHTAVGIGLAPLGVQARFFPLGAIQPFLEGNVGFLWFTRHVADPEGTNLNFAAQAGGGVQIRVARRSRLTISLQHHHLSNAGTGRANPGLNSDILFVGLARALGRGGGGSRRHRD
jgi:hypothetical protein